MLFELLACNPPIKPDNIPPVKPIQLVGGWDLPDYLDYLLGLTNNIELFSPDSQQAYTLSVGSVNEGITSPTSGETISITQSSTLFSASYTENFTPLISPILEISIA